MENSRRNMEMKRIKAAALVALAACALPGCSTAVWKSDAKEIVVLTYNGSIRYQAVDEPESGIGVYYTKSLKYLDEGNAITIEVTTVTLSTPNINAESVEWNEFASTKERVKYSNCTWVITYR